MLWLWWHACDSLLIYFPRVTVPSWHNGGIVLLACLVFTQTKIAATKIWGENEQQIKTKCTKPHHTRCREQRSIAQWVIRTPRIIPSFCYVWRSVCVCALRFVYSTPHTHLPAQIRIIFSLGFLFSSQYWARCVSVSFSYAFSSVCLSKHE